MTDLVADVEMLAVYRELTGGIADFDFGLAEVGKKVLEDLAKSKDYFWKLAKLLNILRNIPSSYYKLDGFEKAGIKHIHLGYPGISLLMLVLFARTVLISSANMEEGRTYLNQLKKLEEDLAEKKHKLKALYLSLSPHKTTDEQSPLLAAKKWSDLSAEDQKLLEWVFKDKPAKLVYLFKDKESSKENAQLEDDASKVFYELFPELEDLHFTQNEREETEKYLRIILQAEMRGFWEKLFAKLIDIMMLINSFVYSVFAGKSTFVLVCAFLTAVGLSGGAVFIPAALSIAVLMFLVTMLTSWYQTGSDIKQDSMTFCDFWLLPKTWGWKHLAYFVAAMSAVSTGALLFITLKPLILLLLVAVGCSNPVGATILASILVGITIIGSVKYLWSLLRALRESFVQRLWKDSDLYEKFKSQDRLRVYWTLVVIGAVFSLAVIGVGILGDVFGVTQFLKKTFPSLDSSPLLAVSIVIAITSFVCNLLQNTDFLYRFPRAVKNLFLKKNLDNKIEISNLAELEQKGQLWLRKTTEKQWLKVTDETKITRADLNGKLRFVPHKIKGNSQPESVTFTYTENNQTDTATIHYQNDTRDAIPLTEVEMKVLVNTAEADKAPSTLRRRPSFLFLSRSPSTPGSNQTTSDSTDDPLCPVTP